MADAKGNLTDFEKMITNNIQGRLKQLGIDQFSEKALANKARRIGAMLTLQTKKNIKGHSLIDTGRLINSIGTEIMSSRKGFVLKYGSFGVDYAAVHEFGSRKNVAIPTHTRQQTMVYGRRVNPFTVTVSAHTRKQNIEEKPFIRPSLAQKRKRIIKILMEAKK
jgi:phage gpG-like protein